MDCSPRFCALVEGREHGEGLREVVDADDAGCRVQGEQGARERGGGVEVDEVACAEDGVGGEFGVI